MFLLAWRIWRYTIFLFSFLLTGFCSVFASKKKKNHKKEKSSKSRQRRPSPTRSLFHTRFILCLFVSFFIFLYLIFSLFFFFCVSAIHILPVGINKMTNIVGLTGIRSTGLFQQTVPSFSLSLSLTLAISLSVLLLLLDYHSHYHTPCKFFTPAQTIEI